jgi:hypothetical protein
MREYVFRLDNNSTSLGDTPFIETFDCLHKRRIHAKAAGDRNVEDGSIGEARQPTHEQLKHLVRVRLESHDPHKV